MSVINRGFFDEAVQTAGEEINYLADINEDTVEESQYEIGLEGTMMHLYEAEEAWNKIQTYVAIEEFMGFKETGDTEYVLEGEKSESFFTSVINWFKSMAGKVVATFKKFVNYMASKIKSDKAFIKKFDGKIKNLVIPSGFTFKGYNYSIDSAIVSKNSDKIKNYIMQKMPRSIVSITQRATEEAKKELDSYNSQKDSIKATIKGLGVGNNKSMSEKEFGIELTKLFRSEQAVPSQISVTSSLLEEYFTYVSSHQDNVKEAKKSMEIIKGQINEAIKYVNKEKTDIKKAEKSVKSIAMSYANAKISLYKEQISILSRVNGALISALNQRNRQAKSVIYAVNARQTKAVGESAVLTQLGNF